MKCQQEFEFRTNKTVNSNRSMNYTTVKLQTRPFHFQKLKSIYTFFISLLMVLLQIIYITLSFISSLTFSTKVLF